MKNVVRKVVVVGGGTAGWMSAALIQRILGSQASVELVESDAIGIVGVGEATIPPIQVVNNVLGLDEREFLRETKGTIKLGIQFENWRVHGESYIHTFGAPGHSDPFCAFQGYWLRARELGEKRSLWDFDFNYLACQKGVFAKFSDRPDALPYAYHFDSGLYGQYLRKVCLSRGVVRTEGKIVEVTLDNDSGFVSRLKLESGHVIQGDLFIDCSGIRGLLIQEQLKTGYEDWSHWLPADSALAVPAERFDTTLPYTRSIAHKVGWQWRIPLTHRNGNGIVYSSNYISDDEAASILMGNLDAKPLMDEPKLIRFKTGRTIKQWNKNVVAVGLSSGFLEPLESTSIYLIQSAVVRLLKLFPNNGIDQALVDQYNAESKYEYETIRDFIILHYYVNERNDSDFWRDMRNLKVPERLQMKIDTFAANGVIFEETIDIFKQSSWLQVMLGQGIIPKDYHPLAKAMPEAELSKMLDQISTQLQAPLGKMHQHDDYLRRYTG